jgi:hypothetical protein
MVYKRHKKVFNTQYRTQYINVSKRDLKKKNYLNSITEIFITFRNHSCLKEIENGIFFMCKDFLGSLRHLPN